MVYFGCMITKLTETTEELTLKINNGDKKALEQITEEWKFKDAESALRFALAVLVKAVTIGNKKLSIEENGKNTTLVPGEALLKPTDETPKPQP